MRDRRKDTHFSQRVVSKCIGDLDEVDVRSYTFDLYSCVLVIGLNKQNVLLAFWRLNGILTSHRRLAPSLLPNFFVPLHDRPFMHSCRVIDLDCTNNLVLYI
jgi:hypothetical protein